MIDDEGTVLARAPGFEEALLVVDVDPSSVVTRRLADGRRRALAQDRGLLGPVPVIHVGSPRAATNGALAAPAVAPFCEELEQMRIALELGLADYVRKNGFREVVVGVSGGIDSALVAALAVEALGPEQGASVEWVHAWGAGQSVVLTSDDERLDARGNDLFHDARTKRQQRKQLRSRTRSARGKRPRPPHVLRRDLRRDVHRPAG